MLARDIEIESERSVWFPSPAWMPGLLTRILSSDGTVALLEQRMSGGAASPCHIHRCEDELIYVLDGELSVYADGTLVRVTTGSALKIRRGSEHAIIVESANATLLVLYIPGGFETMLVELAPEASTGSLEQMVATAARYGCEVTGPPPQLGRASGHLAQRLDDACDQLGAGHDVEMQARNSRA